MHDAHAHVFPTVRGRTRQGPTRSAGYGRIRHGDRVQQLLSPLSLDTSYPVEALIAHLDWAGINRAMLLQGPFYGTTNEYQARALAAYPDRLWGALYFDPWQDEPSVLRALAGTGSFRALKLECSEPTGLCGLHPEADLAAPPLDWIWRFLSEQGLALVLDLGAPGSASYQTEAVAGIARRFPALRILIAHLGQPQVACLQEGAPRELWLQQLGLGRLPNVWFDCAALPAYFPAEAYPYPSAIACMRFALAELGPDKILWGTDQPGLLQWATLPQLVHQARLYAQDLTPDGWARFTEGNFADVYGLP